MFLRSLVVVKKKNAPRQKQTQMHAVAILVPLLVGVGATIGTILIHALAVVAIVHFVRRERRLGYAGTSSTMNVAIIGAAVLFALAAHLIEIGLWAAVFMLCGEFSSVGAALYHSAENYTTLGYGDVVMSPAWRLLGPIEAADGMLMFGVSTALIFTVLQRLVQTRFPDLRG
jgi:Ion channel